MKFLDERIKFTISVPGTNETRPAAGAYTYYLRANNFNTSIGYTNVFVGTFFYDHKATVTLDVSDIIRNNWRLTDTIRDILTKDDPQHFETDEQIIREYWIVVAFGGETGNVESTEHKSVANVWRYPNRSAYNKTLDGANQFFDITTNTFKSRYEIGRAHV